MLKVVAVTMTMLVSTCVVAQQFSISGTVKNEKNQPLAGAPIQIKNSSTTVTDDFGKFRFEKLPAGKYSLHIRFLGYEDKIENVQLDQDAVVEIVLSESV